MKARTAGILLVLGAAALLGGCANLGPGTATGLVVGGAVSAITGDGGRAAAIGAGVGAAADLANGEAPIQPVRPRRDYRYYDDRYDYYYDDRPVYRPVPQRQAPRYYYDRRCGCYRYY